MPYEHKFNAPELRVENVISGVLSRSELETSTAESIALQREHDVYDVLVNALDLDRVDSVTDIYDLPKQYVEQGLSRSTRIAIVMPKSAIGRKVIRFYEDVCINRGWTIQLFETYSEAEKWLSSKQS